MYKAQVLLDIEGYKVRHTTPSKEIMQPRCKKQLEVKKKEKA